MQIIVRKKGSESERRKKETAVQILKHYHGREIRDGTRMKLPPNTSKEQIKKLYDEIRRD